MKYLSWHSISMENHEYVFNEIPRLNFEGTQLGPQVAKWIKEKGA